MLDPRQYSEVRKPLPEAQTLPSHCYISKTFFQEEIEKIFLSCWHFAGREDELTKPGDFITIDTQAGCALICRDGNNHIRAFVNSCRHRGTRLKQGKGNCRHIVCPYHAWSYDLDGSLRAAAGMDGVKGFNHEDFFLQSVRLEQWGGFLFINFSRDTAPLAEWLGDLPKIMASHKPEQTCCVKRFNFDVNANWKFLIENALEAYHTGMVHRATLGAQCSESVGTEGQWDALFVLSEKTKSIATLPGQKQSLPFIQGLDNKSKTGTWFTVIYPCTQIAFSQDCIWWLDIKPMTVDRSGVTLGACFPESSIALPEFNNLAEPYFERWATATPEDNAICESQQRGHSSGLTKPGRYAMSEHCVHALNNWVLDRVLSGKE